MKNESSLSKKPSESEGIAITLLLHSATPPLKTEMHSGNWQKLSKARCEEARRAC